jgi:hypothetical protein
VNKPIHILFFLVVIFLAGVSGAYASISHEHHEGVSNSPFQGKLKSHSLYCQLNKHHPVGQTCPHTHAKGNTIEFRLAVDCAGNPNATVPAVSVPGKSHLLFSAFKLLPVLKNAENIFISSEIFQHFFPDPIDHPPKSS